MADSAIFNFLDGIRGTSPSSSQIISGNSTSKKQQLHSPDTIVIDNGSYECRAGYAAFNQPSLVFKNLAYRQKGKVNESLDVTYVGQDIENLETVRTQLKSPFDKSVVTQFDAQEMICDHIFSKLSVSSEERVDHSIFMSEPIANPNHCRKYMSELMFECYSVPCISYFTDTMASWYSSMAKNKDINCGIMIMIGYQTIHVSPVINGCLDLPNVRRVSLGGYHLDYFMQRLLQLKYPIHAPSISLSRAEEITQGHTSVTEAYTEACKQWLDPSYYDKKVIKMQLPYGNVPANFAVVALQGELQVERAKLIKEKQSLEKLENKKHIFDQLCEIRELTGTKLYRRLAELGVDSLGELQCHIKAVQATVEDLKRKLTFKDEYNKGILTKEWLQLKIDDLDNPDKINHMTSFDIAEYYQLHVGIEQTRVPELLLQPSMLGIDQGGISDTLSYVIKKYPDDIQHKLADNVWLSGGCAGIPGLKERVEADLRCVRPFQSSVCVNTVENSTYSSWVGARTWCMSQDGASIAITKRDYEEYGGEFLREHTLSNKLYPTPKQL